MDLDEAVRRLFLVHRKLILLCVVLGVIGGLAVTALRSNEYTAATRLTLGDAGTVEDAVSAADGAEAVVTSRAIVEAAVQVVGLDVDPLRVAKESISVKTLGSSDLVQLEVTDMRPDVASALANALAQELVDRWGDVGGGQSAGALFPLQDEIGGIRDDVAAADERIALLSIRIARGRPADVQSLEARRDALDRQRDGLEVQRLFLESQLNRLLVDGARRSAPEVIDPAVPSARPDPKHELSTAALGGFLGFLVGICVAALVESVRPTIARPEAIADALGAPMLGKMRPDASGSAAEIRGPALKARLAARAVNAKTVELVTVGPPIALSRLAEAMEHFDPATEPGRPHVTGASGRLTVRRFEIDPAATTQSDGSDANSRSALVAVLPSKIKRSDLSELIDLRDMTSWPLVGVVSYDSPSSVWPRAARRRNAGAGTLGLSQRTVRSHEPPLRRIRRGGSLGWRPSRSVGVHDHGGFGPHLRRDCRQLRSRRRG